MIRQSAEQIFHEAREMPSEEWSAFLRGACGPDVALRSKVEGLLRADAEAGDFMRTLDAENARPASTESNGERPGEMIGRYKILQRIGEGGFGAVYLAEQREPVKRRIALKIIKLGMDTRQVIARFEAERQALAMMDHPNIAKVLDAGATDTGRPYFVMELVRGVPMTEYCDTENLTTRERLDLFIKVCNAVQHAHQKGIIHRDLKPSNVLITLHDGEPVPKVIDFGIAKATNRELTDMTLFTEFRQFIGTPEYMSPEQAEMSGLDIDTRSDIYSLGVLLYELLTGSTPFDVGRLRSAGINEIQRIIREEHPAKPSTRLSALSSTASAAGIADTPDASSAQHIARHRRTEPKQLARQLKGDLDWIVLKAMEKDRARRYETANGLALDIERHLRNEPVLASPPSALYRLRKMAGRNRGAVAAAAVVFLVLTLGVAGTSFGMVRAIEAGDRAETELARATEVKRVIREMLSGVRPEVALGADTTLLESILADTSRRLEAGEITDMLIAAELQAIVGDTYWQIGLDAEAQDHLTKSINMMRDVLGPGHPQTLRTTNALLWPTYCRMSRQHAIDFIAETLELQRRVLGPDDRDTLHTQSLLGSAHAFAGRFDAAEPLLRGAHERQGASLGPSDRHTLMTRAYIGMNLSNAGRDEEAVTSLEETIALQSSALGPQHPDTLMTMSYLADHYRDLGQFDDAAPVCEAVLEGRRRVLGVNHWRTSNSLNRLLTVLHNVNEPERADSILQTLLHACETEGGEVRPRSFDTLNEIAWFMLTRKPEGARDPEAALPIAQRAALAAEAANSRSLWAVLDTLALAQHLTGDAVSALATQKRAVALMPDDVKPEDAEKTRRLIDEYQAAVDAERNSRNKS